MTNRTHLRLIILYVTVGALLLVLMGRLWTMQVLEGRHYRQVAADNRTRDIVVPAVRGMILDDQGRALVRNRTALVVSADRTVLMRQKDRGRAVLTRLAGVLGTTYEDLVNKTRLCGPGIKRPCWPGSPYQPIPVDDKVDAKRALQIMERQEDFPGVTAQVQAVRDYPRPGGANAAQTLGYLQPITQEELDKRKGLKVTGYSGVDLIGRDGLEAAYDADLRGEPGFRRLLVDSQGRVTGTAQEKAATPGGNLVTSIDAGVQGAAEKAVQDAVKSARSQGKHADSGAAVVMDVQTGHVAALASYPTYDPSIWTGGISQDQYDALLGKKKGEPLISRATQGQFAPGSTFKISSVSAAVADGYDLHGTYSCPGSYDVGNRAFRNFEGESKGSMSLHEALVVSCDTVFYKFAYEEWLRDGGTKPKKNPADPMVKMARQWGFGKKTGIDLPSESAGRIPDRAWKTAYWDATKKADCKAAKDGYPDLERSDPSRAAYLKAVAAENCAEGYVWRAGDAANFSVGQGDVLSTPLQLTRAYAALANGGRLVVPRIARAVVRADGTVVRRVPDPPAAKLPVDPKVLKYVRGGLDGVTKSGTAAGAFGGFDFKTVDVAGKTGTAEVYGKDDTSWFASFAPVDNPRYAVVVMISQGGQGANAAAPAVRQIYEAMYGLGKGGKPMVGKDGRLPSELPRPEAAIDPEPGPSAGPPAGPSAGPSGTPSPGPSTPGGAGDPSGAAIPTVGPSLQSGAAGRRPGTGVTP
ncbi:penicillin-binding protein 2 [Actinomadura harenae]|uniref:Penicillin-binding protein 2 n=1 Tax=Actinomadura harenae TaxID=2483351 RepID=A0A3M2M8N7_9ACTN|nr:penicillin-binding protein 2 [Actinomadura harenae]RMI45976.1 penicillin-binding protein 2 [Actinomadura harenae]